MLYLNPRQVREMIRQAAAEDETVVIRCVRKGPASKSGGPTVGELHDLHCVRKPDGYRNQSGRDRSSEDESTGTLTVFVNNRRGSDGNWGAWRRVNIEQVQKVVFKGHEYEVRAS
jgi:hypothetical protein